MKSYETADIAFAAYLSMGGFDIVDVSFNQGRATFYFEGKSDEDGLEMKFFSRKTTVEPIAFLDHLKTLKAMLSNLGRENVKKTK